MLDSPAGQIARDRAGRIGRAGGTRVDRASASGNVPSFVLLAGVPVRLGIAHGAGRRRLRRRVLRHRRQRGGWACRSGRERLDDLRRAGHGDQARGRGGADASCIPSEPRLRGIYGTIFTGPPIVADADLRNVTIFADAEVDRSPCGTGTCAVMAVLAAMGLLAPEQTFTHESIIGTRFRGRVERETTVGGHAGDRARSSPARPS